MSAVLKLSTIVIPLIVSPGISQKIKVLRHKNIYPKILLLFMGVTSY